MPYPVRFVILGGGNFGLALSHVLARNSIPTTLLVRKQSVADHINEVASSKLGVQTPVSTQSLCTGINAGLACRSLVLVYCIMR